MMFENDCLAEIARLTTALEAARTRLECNYAFRLNKETHELERVETDLPEHMDGISCRDETIKLLQEGNDKLRAALEEAKANLHAADMGWLKSDNEHEAALATARRDSFREGYDAGEQIEREVCARIVESFATPESLFTVYTAAKKMAANIRTDNSGHQTDGFVKLDKAAIGREEREALDALKMLARAIFSPKDDGDLRRATEMATSVLEADAIRARTDGKPGT